MSMSGTSTRGTRYVLTESKGVLATFDVFLLLVKKVGAFPSFLTLAGLVIQMMQIWSFVFSPMWLYNFYIVRQVSYFVAAFAMPLYDRNFGTVSYTAFSVVLIVGALLLVLACTLFALAAMYPIMLERRLLVTLLRCLLESLTSWLFIPLMNLFLGGMMCSTGHVMNFPAASCSTDMFKVNMAFGVVGIVLLTVLTLFMTQVYDADPESEHPVARPHTFVDLFVLCIKIVLCFTLHFSRANNTIGALAIVALVLALLWLFVLYAVVPYYNFTTPALQAIFLSLTMLFAVIDICSTFGLTTQVDTFTTPAGMAVGALLPGVALLGYCLVRVRVNKACEQALHVLHHYGFVPEHVAELPYPRTLAVADHYIVMSGVRSLEKDLVQEMAVEEDEFNFFSQAASMTGQGDGRRLSGSGSEADDDDDDDSDADHADRYVNKATGPSQAAMRRMELLIPYIKRVRLPTDVEVATRFLRFYREKSGEAVKNSPEQLVFALRIYVKGLAYFRQSQYVTVCMGSFLRKYCKRPGIVLEVLREMRRRGRSEANLMVLFKAYRLQKAVNEEIGLRDRTHLFALHHARSHHREALLMTLRLWSALREHTDMGNLVKIYDQLTVLRRSAMDNYQLALSISQDDRTTLYFISAFVDDLFAEEELAQDIRRTIDDIELQKKSRLLRGAQSKAQHQIPQVDFSSVIATIQIDSTQRSTAHTIGQRILTTLLYITLLLCLGVNIFVLLFTKYKMSMLFNHVHRVHHANAAIDRGEAVIFYTEQVSTFDEEHECGLHANSCSSDVTRNALIQNLADAEDSLASELLIVMEDRYTPPASSQTHATLTEAYLPLTILVDSMKISNESYLDSIGNTGYYNRLVAVRDAHPFAQVLSFSNYYALSQVTNYYNRVSNLMNATHAMQFMVDGSLDKYLAAMSGMIEVTEADAEDCVTAMVVAMPVLGTVFFFLLLLLLFIFFVKIRWVSKNRAMLMKMFGTIPQYFLGQLQERNEQRLSAFDASGYGQDDELVVLDPQAEVSTEGEVRGTAGYGAESSTSYNNNNNHYYNGDQTATGQGGEKSAALAEQERQKAAFVRALLEKPPLPSSLRQTQQQPPQRQQQGQKQLQQRRASKTAHFILSQQELAEDKPKARLHEPKITVTGSGEKIVEEFRRSMADISKELQQETQQEQSRNLSDTDTIVTAGYAAMRVHLKRIFESLRRSVAVTTKVLAVAFLLLLILGVVDTVMISLYVRRQMSLTTTASHITDVSSSVEEYMSVWRQFDLDVMDYLDKPSVEAAKAISKTFVLGGAYNSLLTSALSASTTRSEVFANAVSQLTSATLRLKLTDMIYVTLVARAVTALQENDLSAMPYLAPFNYTSDEISDVMLVEEYADYIESPEEYIILGLNNLPDDPQAMLNIVRHYHDRKRYIDDVATIQEAYYATREALLKDLLDRTESGKSDAHTYRVAGIVLTVVYIAGVMAILAVAIRRSLQRALIYLLAAALLCAVVTLGLFIGFSASAGAAQRKQVTYSHYVGNMALYKQRVFERNAMTRQLVHNPNNYVFDQIWHLAPSKIDGLLDELVDANLARESQVADVKTNDEKVWERQQVALLLSYMRKMKTMNPDTPIEQLLPPSPPFNLDYNNKDPPNPDDEGKKSGMLQRTRRYTRPSKDLKESPKMLKMMARYASSGSITKRALNNCWNEARDLMRNVYSSYKVHLNKDHTTNYRLYACVVFMGVATLALFVAAVVPIFVLTVQLAEGSYGDLVKTVMSTSYGGIIKLTVGFVAFSVVLMVVEVVLICVSTVAVRDAMAISKYSSSRLQALTRCLTFVAFANRTFHTDSPLLGVNALNSVMSSMQDLIDAREYLFLRSDADTGGLMHEPSLSDDQKKIFFTPDSNGDSVDTNLTEFINTMAEVSQYVPDILCPAVSGVATAKVVCVPTDTQKATLSARAAKVVLMYDGINDAFTMSNKLYKITANTVIGRPTKIAKAFFALQVVALAVIALFHVPRIMRRLRVEENDSRLLLKTIPRNIHNAVPSIAMYAESGIVAEDMFLTGEQYKLSDAARRFLSVWRSTDPAQREPEIFAGLNTVAHGVVMADEQGVINYANGAMHDMTHSESLVGKGVEVLMSPGIAATHQRFVQNYIDHRMGRNDHRPMHVTLYATNGETFGAALVLADAPAPEGPMYFLAEFYRVDAGRTRKGQYAQHASLAHRASISSRMLSIEGSMSPAGSRGLF